MMNLLEKLLFQDKLVDDVREPIWTFQINHVTWEVLLPSVTFWMQLTSILGILCIYGTITSTIVYYCIIQQRKKNNRITSYLVGYGIILPMTLCVPPILTQSLDIQNMLLRFCASCVLPALIIFRTSEAMYGYLPNHAMKSFSRFVFYFSTTLPYNVINNNKDKGDQLQRVSNFKIFSALLAFGKYFILLSFYYSIFGPYNYEPFSSHPIDANHTWNLWSSDCNILQVYMNNTIGAGLIQLNLSAFTYGIGIISMVVTGIDFNVDDSMNNPLLTATSPSDFWGRKWNSIVHSVLKNGVFKPMYNFTSNRPLAVFSSFIASGLFHEWILWCIYRCYDNDSSDCNVFIPTYGKQMAFFLWNAMMIFLESIFLPRNINMVPSFLKTFLTISTAMPVAHWFLHCYIKSETRLFQHAKIAFFLIRQVSSE